jgi:hypothetical protein
MNIVIPPADNPARDHMALLKERHEPMVLPNPDDIRHVIAAASAP